MGEVGRRGATRSVILDAARQVAAEKGMRAVTVRAVSEAAGVGMGTLRHHFPSQRELFAELVAELVDDRVDDSVVMESSAGGPERLEQAVGQLLPDDYSDPPTLAAWFDVYAAAFARPPAEHSRQVLEAGAERSHEHLRRWLVHLAREGWLEVTRIEEVGEVLGALSSGLLLESLTPGSPVTFETARSTLGFAARRMLHDSPAPLGALDPAARSRFTVPWVTLPVTARERPDRAVYVSNETGVFQVYAWDRRSGDRWRVTDEPRGRSCARSALMAR